MAQIGNCVREKLDAGDYSAKVPMPDGTWFRVPVAIERKMSLDELAGCYCQSRRRFTAEFDRAKRAGTKMYMIIEEATWEKVYNGTYRSRMKPKSFVSSILAWLARYDCQILFCSQKTTGTLIKDILYREAKETLMRMVDSG